MHLYSMIIKYDFWSYHVWLLGSQFSFPTFSIQNFCGPLLPTEITTHLLMNTSSLKQRFSIPVLAPPRSAYFVCYSYRFRCLFYWNVSALRSGHHRIFLHDSSSKRTYIFHSKCIEVCKTWIKIVYIYRGIWCHTHPCVKTLRSANPWMNVSEMK